MKRFLVTCLTLFVAGSLLSNPNQILKTNAFSDEMRGHFAQASAILEETVETKDIRGLVYLVKDYPLYENAGGTGAVVTYVSSGQSLVIEGVEVLGDDTKSAGFESWVEVSVVDGDVTYHGYLPRGKVATSDEDFLAWEMNYSANPMYFEPMAVLEEQAEAEINSFPESYREGIRALKEAHPTWTFVPTYTNKTWQSVMDGQLSVNARALVPSSWPAYTKKSAYSASWSNASADTLAYYMDPRSWLTETGIFQFEHLAYSETNHTQEALQTFLDGTFMAGKVPDMNGDIHTYAYILMAIGKENNVSPFHLATRIIQEQGRDGTSPLISGTVEGYENLYNFFNIGASGSSAAEEIRTGLEYAKNANPQWNCRYYAIHYGTKIIVQNYIAKQQDTLYYQKFNVINGNYGHQYMQNIVAPSSEGSNTRKLYADSGKLESPFVFNIPIYNNMPAEACGLPARAKSVSVPILDGYNDAKIYIDGKEYEAVKHGGYYVTHAADGNAKIAVMYKYDANGIPTGMAVWELSYNGTYYNATELTSFRDLLSYDGFAIRITGDTGIRFVTGIKTSVRDALTTGGLHGYTLKELGTLALPESYLDKYPLVYGGTSVKKGISYGTDSEGKFWNTYLTKNEKQYTYASVLTKIQVQNYARRTAFRGYAVLTKDGKDTIIYGPMRASNIYDLAVRFLGKGTYPEGSAARLFLEKIVSDYDAYLESLNPPKESNPMVSDGDATEGTVSDGDAKEETTSSGDAA